MKPFSKENRKDDENDVVDDGMEKEKKESKKLLGIFFTLVSYYIHTAASTTTTTVKRDEKWWKDENDNMSLSIFLSGFFIGEDVISYMSTSSRRIKLSCECVKLLFFFPLLLPLALQASIQKTDTTPPPQKRTSEWSECNNTATNVSPFCFLHFLSCFLKYMGKVDFPDSIITHFWNTNVICFKWLDELLGSLKTCHFPYYNFCKE